jgi:hypothetical protein
MSTWPNRKKAAREGSSRVFAPFSREAKAWEPYGQQLRALAACGKYDILDPFKLAPLVNLTVMDGNHALSLLSPDNCKHICAPKASITGREASCRILCPTAHIFAS